jgi:hypothetical protein
MPPGARRRRPGTPEEADGGFEPSALAAVEILLELERWIVRANSSADSRKMVVNPSSNGYAGTTLGTWAAQPPELRVDALVMGLGTRDA